MSGLEQPLILLQTRSQVKKKKGDLMKLKFNSKSQEFEQDGTVKCTKVLLTNDDGALYPVLLDAEKISLSNSELEELALEVVYQENFPQRAENEKINELSQELKKQQEISVVDQGALLDLISQLHAQGVLTDET